MPFQIGEHDFLLHGKPFKIISGAVHYFRIVPDYWYRTLYNLKAMGCNSVETYVPWNLHQPQPDQFYFDDNADLVRFIQIAQQLELYIILRPSPYICAEWEFGGLPAWLLNIPNLRPRSNSPEFLTPVKTYLDHLLPLVTPYQITRGGNIIMMQIENEYGSFGNDKDYLRAIRQIMLENGVDVPLFTSDGAWQNALEAGALIEDDILPTGNFGSRSNENLDQLQLYFLRHNRTFPLMCMEFWDGWFNRWKEPVITRDAQDLAACSKALLDRASINFYMLQGGTNFGFWSGCSARGDTDLPQVTSYDYDAPIREWGEPSQKFYLLQQVLKQYPDASPICEPLLPHFFRYADLPLQQEVSLFSTLDKISFRHDSPHTQNMEQLGHYHGYILYRTFADSHSDELKLRIYQARDRVQVFNDQQKVTTQYQHEIGADIMLQTPNDRFQLDLLVENMGRVNYGGKMLAPTQRKGISGGVVLDLHFHSGWQQYVLDFTKLHQIDFSGSSNSANPSFYQFKLTLEQAPQDSFIDTSTLGKGVIIVNGKNLGRYWSEGPTCYLYLPAPYLQQGDNSIIVFETEGVRPTALRFSDKPIYKTLTSQNL
ncbi:glycoside hydrolase family 35 protein [Testudinibacter aquarius]|uniref:Beta-galactosidase n=1 Tax=Testudinibacter aquarius TaxID=1524974 RepID=A0A4R3XY67_9PAST|nr:beta-galactosidase family protein [Testudinibacter aquarius]KAE9527786.1 beta-galactosidase [Testudinibacter aquarius]TCV83238.1 beta-galactosidase [Testudinibacter aquarius]TNG90410.1 beta-galactosidase [Testudinibacter aquarius]